MAEDRWEREERYGRDIERAGGKQPAPWNESVVICLPDAYHHLLVWIGQSSGSGFAEQLVWIQVRSRISGGFDRLSRSCQW